MILVTGAAGQLGNDLVTALVARHGGSAVLATDLRCCDQLTRTGADTASLDVTDADAVASLVRANGFDQIYHLAGILSARGEKQPDLCWKVNVDGLKNVLDAVRGTDARVFWPSCSRWASRCSAPHRGSGAWCCASSSRPRWRCSP